MDKRKDELIENDMMDAIIEKPYIFKADKFRFSIYPATLGKTILLKPYIKALDIEQSHSPYESILKVVREKRDEVAMVIAYHTIREKERIFDAEYVEQRVVDIKENMDDKDMAMILTLCLSKDSRLNEFEEHVGIDKDRTRRHQVMKVKDSKNTFTFGGLSMYGALIDAACERYGWTMDYVVWGISHINLLMLLSDQVTSVYLTDEERKKVRISNDRTYVNGDDPSNNQKIIQMFSE